MGVIAEWQEVYDTSDFFLDHLETFKRQRAEGTDTEERYHLNMALICVMRKECDRVRYHCEKISPDAESSIRAEVSLAMARVMVMENKIDEALELYELCWQTCPDLEMAFTEGGQIYSELNRHREALVMFERSLVVEPECDVIYSFAGRAAAELEDYELALKYFTKAIEFDERKENTAENEYFVGLSYDRLGDFYRALHHYTLCLDADPLFGEALGNMAALYYNQEGDVQNAITYLKKAETAAEETENTHLMGLVHLNLAQLYNKIKDFENHEYYHRKVMEGAGFGFLFEDVEEDDEDDNDGVHEE